MIFIKSLETLIIIRFVRLFLITKLLSKYPHLLFILYHEISNLSSIIINYLYLYSFIKSMSIIFRCTLSFMRFIVYIISNIIYIISKYSAVFSPISSSYLVLTLLPLTYTHYCHFIYITS